MRQSSVDKSEDWNQRWRPALMAFFVRRIGDRAEAEDLTQEVFERMLRSDASIANPNAFVFQIAANLLADRHRRAQVRERYRHLVEADEWRDIELKDPQTIALGREAMACLVEALRALPERTRTLFVLYKFEQMSQDSIAERYGISASAVKQHVAKAMAFLATQMRDVK
ncbi:RNA polymerase sigma factor [Sphingomonas sp. CJ20]